MSKKKREKKEKNEKDIVDLLNKFLDVRYNRLPELGRVELRPVTKGFTAKAVPHYNLFFGERNLGRIPTDEVFKPIHQDHAPNKPILKRRFSKKSLYKLVDEKLHN